MNFFSTASVMIQSPAQLNELIQQSNKFAHLEKMPIPVVDITALLGSAAAVATNPQIIDASKAAASQVSKSSGSSPGTSGSSGSAKQQLLSGQAFDF